MVRPRIAGRFGTIPFKSQEDLIREQQREAELQRQRDNIKRQREKTRQVLGENIEGFEEKLIKPFEDFDKEKELDNFIQSQKDLYEEIKRKIEKGEIVTTDEIDLLSTTVEEQFQLKLKEMDKDKVGPKTNSWFIDEMTNLQIKIWDLYGQQKIKETAEKIEKAQETKEEVKTEELSAQVDVKGVVEQNENSNEIRKDVVEKKEKVNVEKEYESFIEQLESTERETMQHYDNFIGNLDVKDRDSIQKINQGEIITINETKSVLNNIKENLNPKLVKMHKDKVGSEILVKFMKQIKELKTKLGFIYTKQKIENLINSYEERKETKETKEFNELAKTIDEEEIEQNENGYISETDDINEISKATEIALKNLDEGTKDNKESLEQNNIDTKTASKAIGAILSQNFSKLKEKKSLKGLAAVAFVAGVTFSVMTAIHKDPTTDKLPVPPADVEAPIPPAEVQEPTAEVISETPPAPTIEDDAPTPPTSTPTPPTIPTPPESVEVPAPLVANEVEVKAKDTISGLVDSYLQKIPGDQKHLLRKVFDLSKEQGSENVGSVKEELKKFGIKSGNVNLIYPGKIDIEGFVDYLKQLP